MTPASFILTTMAWVLPWVFGWLLARRVLRGQAASASRSAAWCEFFLGGALGLGITSCTFFAWLVVAGSASRWYFWCELPVLLAGVVWLARSSVDTAKRVASPRVPRTPQALWLTAAVVVGAIVAVSQFVLRTAWEPWGNNDAVSFWNLKARFLFLGGEQWRDCFVDRATGQEFCLVPDYPFLLPATVARFWTASGSADSFVPALLALVFLTITVGLAGAVVTRLRGVEQGLIAMLLLLGTSFLLKTSATQHADVPLGCYLLCAMSVLALPQSGAQRGAWLVAGLLAGLAAWTKNDGIVFGSILLAAQAFDQWRRDGLRQAMRTCWPMAIGLTAILAIVALGKFWIAPSDPLIAEQGRAATLARVTDLSRYGLIARYFCTGMLQVCGPQLLVLAGLMATARRRPRGWLADQQAGSKIALLWILVALAGVYVVTPHPLEWHLSSSLTRVLLQSWPAWVVMFCLWHEVSDKVETASSAIRAPHYRARPAAASVSR